MEMDVTDDVAYLTLLNDGTNNYLLHSAEETLGIQEPMLTEINDDSESWSVGLPILMNSTLIPEAHQEFETVLEPGDIVEPNGLPKLDSVIENEENSHEIDKVAFTAEISGNGLLTSDSVFITNDLLRQFKVNTENEVVDGKKSKIIENVKRSAKNINRHFLRSTDQEALMNPQLPKANNSLDFHHENCVNLVLNVSNESTSNNTVHLLSDVVNANEDFLSSFELNNKTISVSNELSSSFYERITAYKCKECQCLYEFEKEMEQHISTVHFNFKQVTRVQGSCINAKNSQNNINKPVFLKSNNNKQMTSILKSNMHQTVYVCSECDVRCTTLDILKNHMMTIHKLTEQLREVNSPIKTANTNDEKASHDKHYSNKKLTVDLIKKHARASKKIKCSVKGCDLRFAVDSMRKRHEKCHVEGQKKQFVCFECNTKFSLWRVCSAHLWKCHKLDVGLYTCQMCSVFKASSPMRLATHMAIHNDEKPYTCPDCNKTFKQHSQLQNHQIIHKNPEDIPRFARQQMCDICQKFFANSKSLKKHVKSVHDKFKPFICNVCGHQTTRKAMLELHLRQHTGEKPHKCNICDYRTGDHNSLRRHSMRHSGEAKYSCPHCNYQSIQSTSYKNHIASKHPGLGGSYFCSLCSYHTVNENIYTSHLSDHEKGLIKEANGDGADKVSPTILKSIVKINPSSVNNCSENTKSIKNVERDATHNYLSMLNRADETVDTGGITIPADYDVPS